MEKERTGAARVVFCVILVLLLAAHVAGGTKKRRMARPRSFYNYREHPRRRSSDELDFSPFQSWAQDWNSIEDETNIL